MHIGIQLLAVNTFQEAVWGDEVMANGLAQVLSEQEGVSGVEVYDPITIHDNLDVILDLYPFPLARPVKGPKHYWWYQARVYPELLEDPAWKDFLPLYEGFFAASPNLKQHLMGWGVPENKIAVMPMSCDLDVYRPRKPCERFSHDVVFCGNGAIRTPDSVERYLLPLRDLGLKIYGATWERHPELVDCVVGPLLPSEVPSLYSSAKVVISTHTGWHFHNDLPTSRLWEALGCEAVVVSDRVPFAEHLFGDAVVWTDGFEDVREKVTHLLTHPQVMAFIKGKGRRIIDHQLSFQAYAPMLLEAFRTGRMEDFFFQTGGKEMLFKNDIAKEPPFMKSLQEATRGRDWIQKGEEAFEAGNTEEAEGCFRKALQADPFLAKAHSNLSVISWQRGEVEEALTRLTRALELDQGDPDIILNCSTMFHSLGKTEDAKEVLRSYLTKKPWDREMQDQLEALDKPPMPVPTVASTPSVADFFNEQGELQFEKGNAQHARACFEMALESNPEHAGAHGNLGVIHWQAGDLKSALDHLYRALDLNPDDPDILVNCAKALLAAGELDSAAGLLRLYLQGHPQDESAWEDYASVLQRAGASSWLPNGLGRSVADIYQEAGERLAEAGDYAGAADMVNRVLQIDSERTEAYCLLAQLHLKWNQPTEALESLREGLRKEPLHKASVLAAGKIFVARGEKAEARNLFKAFLDSKSDAEIRSALEEIE